ncbi:MAG TPA: hypothetical protein VJ654_18425 [Noviherbaspirillum sp.]|nr:hypothetical protein [Noviherbaspirillum sp.]
MKQILFALLFVAAQASASNPPVSGTFSNASENAASGTYNLVVTATENGQQFFIQCLKDGKAGFGKLTQLPKPMINAQIDAGAQCPVSKIEVMLDYEEAYITVNGKNIALPRRGIYVPIID